MRANITKATLDPDPPSLRKAVAPEGQARTRPWLRRSWRAAALLGLLYCLAHLAAVPALSIATRRPVSGRVTPAEWGLAYSAFPIACSPWGPMPGWLLPGGKDAPVVMVLAGSGGNRVGSVSRTLAFALHRRGYDVLLFDTRGQGDSPGIKTFGIGEARDVACAVDAIERARPGARVGAIGFSLGAASVLRAAALEPRLQAVATYASYAEMDSALIRSEVAGYGGRAGGSPAVSSPRRWPSFRYNSGVGACARYPNPRKPSARCKREPFCSCITPRIPSSLWNTSAG